MSSLLEKARPKSAGPVLGGSLPQVNLLPPEVNAARGLRATKRVLGIGLVLTVVAALGATGVAKVDEQAAHGDLNRAQAETVRLQNEMKKYAEVPRVKGALSAAQSTRQLAMATDVQWKSYLDSIAAVLPGNVSISTYQLAMKSASQSTAAQPGQVGATSVGTLGFTGESLTVPDTAAWVDALNSVPGFSDAWVTATSVSASTDNKTYYTVQASVQVTAEAFSHRFDVTKAGS
jgi:hypothetical protein